MPATFLAPGDPDDAVTVEDERVLGGSYKRDVAIIRYEDATTGRVVYEKLRASEAT